jgi:hypothetical protein
MHLKTLWLGSLFGLTVCLAGCGPNPPPAPYAVSPAPQADFAPATRDGKVTPSNGSGYNPETGTRAQGH